MKYSAVLFDFDGTLADTKADVWTSLEYAAKQLGGILPAEYCADSGNLGRSVEEIFHAVVPVQQEDKISVFQENVRLHYRKWNPFSKTVLFFGIEDLLIKCREENLPCYIVTNKPEEPLKKILLTKNWGKYFQSYICPDSNPGRILSKAEMIRQLLGEISQAPRAVFVGDTYSDIAAAKENRMDSIGVLYGDGNPDLVLAEHPRYVVRKPEQITEILFSLDDITLAGEA